MKKLAALLCGAVIAVSSVCSATVSPDKIGIGHAVPGMHVDDLIRLYGQPVSRHGDDLIFRNFKAEIDDDHHNRIESIETRSGVIATPAGVAVGQSADILTRVYGAADRVDVEHDESEYEYYSHDYSKKIEFKVVNGIIIKIECKVQD